MEVKVNGKTQSFQSAVTLQDVVEFFGIESKRMAVELNEKLVKRSEWKNTEIRANDRLELLEFVGGG